MIKFVNIYICNILIFCTIKIMEIIPEKVVCQTILKQQKIVPVDIRNVQSNNIHTNNDLITKQPILVCCFSILCNQVIVAYNVIEDPLSRR